jgi:hypothetical protein
MDIIFIILFVAVWVGFISYNAGHINGCLRERRKWKEKTRLMGYYDVEEFYPEEE